MKFKRTALAALAFGALAAGLTGCTGYSDGSNEIPTVNDIRIEKEYIAEGIYLFCVDEVAYLGNSSYVLTPAPQYDERCVDLPPASTDPDSGKL